METQVLDFSGISVRTVTVRTVIVGTGAAGYNAAVSLSRSGDTDLAIVTEGVQVGTSRNAGSDKQTYYKLSLSASEGDSPHAMAEDLFAGGCVDGDNALAEAANSARCFLSLCELGVDFPVNRYGEYVGYRTDHDTRARATSAGPLTSKRMTECLQAEVRRRGIKVFDRCLVIDILRFGDRTAGILCLDLNGADCADTRFLLFRSGNIIYATGGPAGIYADSVYPAGHSGGTGVAFLAGASGQNLTEWQYGLASTAPRWNVSGTYMQVLPCFLSVGEDGDEREFLLDGFRSIAEALSMVFRKGYEWPFDSRKALRGSSVIDLLVYRETVLRGRRVFLDFRKNPFSLHTLPLCQMDPEASRYLLRAKADFGTPIQRLEHMNMPAAALYASKGLDLHRERLEISLCAQHNNGGLAVDLWWQTDIQGLYAVGECAGTHGVCRPGGSALNAGQVGALRAAQYIAQRGFQPLDAASFEKAAAPEVQKHAALCAGAVGYADTVHSALRRAQHRMSRCAGAIRDTDQIAKAAEQAREELHALPETAKVPTCASLGTLYRLRDVLAAQYMYLCAMRDYAAGGGGSRGSAIYTDPAGEKPYGMEELFRFVPDGGAHNSRIQQIALAGGEAHIRWRDVRPLPAGGGFFETIWREYRETKNIF